MQLHQIKPKTKRKKKKRIGRGGKRGTYSGRGIKGQKSRAGRRIRPAIRDRIKKLPKLRGYRMKTRTHLTAAINVGLLDRHFKDADTVNPSELMRRGLISRVSANSGVKILGSGAITKKLIIKGCRVSKSAAAKIARAGGNIENK